MTLLKDYIVNVPIKQNNNAAFSSLSTCIDIIIPYLYFHTRTTLYGQITS